MSRLLSSLSPLFRELQIAYFRWAIADMGPLHPDLPEAVTRLRELLDQPGPQPFRAIWRLL